MEIAVSFKDFDQISYVTNDIDRAIDIMSSRHGVSDLQITPAKFAARVGDKSGVMDLTIATTVIDHLRLEIIQPNAEIDRFYSCRLPADGSFGIAFHHTGILVNGTLDQWLAHFDTASVEGRVYFTGDLGEDMKFFYADERDTLGHYVEHLWLSERMRQSLRK